MNFKQKVQSMTAKEIITAMVESLTPPPLIKIDMASYGEIKTQTYFFGLFTKKVCFGCAATNTICKISGKKFTTQNIMSTSSRAEFIFVDATFLNHFERAIDCLRRGDVDSYNERAKIIAIATIKPNKTYLPRLNDDYTIEELGYYINLANEQ